MQVKAGEIWTVTLKKETGSRKAKETGAGHTGDGMACPHSLKE